MTNENFRRSLSDYLREVSAWRRARYDDDLRDRRNLQSADSLRALADFVDSLPADDPRLIRLAELGPGPEYFLPGQQTAYETGRFHFHSTDTSFDAFLDAMIDMAEQDRREQGHYGGLQAPGDNPWG